MRARFVIELEGDPDRIEDARARIAAASDAITTAAETLHLTIIGRPTIETTEGTPP